jgi:hypothetical protein
MVRVDWPTDTHTHTHTHKKPKKINTVSFAVLMAALLKIQISCNAVPCKLVLLMFQMIFRAKLSWKLKTEVLWDVTPCYRVVISWYFERQQFLYLGLLDPEDEDSTVLQNVGKYSPNNTAYHLQQHYCENLKSQNDWDFQGFPQVFHDNAWSVLQKKSHIVPFMFSPIHHSHSIFNYGKTWILYS